MQRSTESDIPTISIGLCFETFQDILERHLHTLNFNVITRFSDYQELLKKLEKGIVDVVISPQNPDVKGICYTPVGRGNIVLIASKDIDGDAFNVAVETKDISNILSFIKKHKWYGASSDDAHFKRFWQTNFNSMSDFRAQLYCA